MVVRCIGIYIPDKIRRANYISIDVELHAPVDHTTHIVPARSKPSVRIRNGNSHQHVGRILVIELDIKRHPVHKSQMQADIRGPEFFPFQIFIAFGHGINTRIAVVVYSATYQCQMVEVGDRRVSRRTRTKRQLCIGQPFYIFKKFFITQVPHQTDRPKSGPPAFSAEARGTVRSDREISIITVVEVILPASEERHIGVGRAVVRP